MYKSLKLDTVLAAFVIITILSDGVKCNNKNKEIVARQTKFPPCKACKNYIDSFKRGMKKTEKGKFEGGDTAWEEEKLLSYSNSEIRLVEIQENLCSDLKEGQDQCYSLNEQFDQEIEDWWFKYQNSNPDLYKYFCIETIQYCCIDDHYGPECLPCPGYPDNICSNNGKCKGAGTRKGSGQCHCNKEYAGKLCDTCAAKYFQSYKDEKIVLCTECHIACDGTCTKAGSLGCDKCANGWINDTEKGCLDINECAAPTSPCSPLQFCVNTDGSYKCLDCDRSCAGCNGDGPDMCNNCASGFVLRDNMCIDAEQENRQKHVFITRYCTYFGLCVATCIIFQRSSVFAAVIGLAVAVYISLSEYILNTPLMPNTTSIADQIMRATNSML